MAFKDDEIAEEIEQTSGRPATNASARVPGE